MQFIIQFPVPLVPPKIATSWSSKHRHRPSQLVVVVLLLMLCP